LPGAHPLGRIAQRRITDSAAVHSDAFTQRVRAYTPGDTDLAWTRLTRWREYLAAILDQRQFGPVTEVEVIGGPESPSTNILAAWLELALEVPTTCTLKRDDSPLGGVRSVTLHTARGHAQLERVAPDRAILRQPGQPEHEIVLPRRTLRE